MSAERNNWEQRTNTAVSYQWASHLVLNSLVGRPLSDEQQSELKDYRRQNSDQGGIGIQDFSLHLDPVLPYWGTSFYLRACDEAMALDLSATAALEGLAHAGIDVEALEYVSGSLVNYSKLQADARIAKAAGEEPITIAHPQYQLPDQDLGRKAFFDAQAFYTELASL